MTDKELLNQALEYLEDNQHWVADGERHAYVMEYNAFIDKLKQALAQPEQEPVVCVEYTPCCTDQTCPKCKAAAPPQRTWVVFPTMLRKMWSGGEVQAWLDENVNKEKNT